MHVAGDDQDRINPGGDVVVSIEPRIAVEVEPAQVEAHATCLAEPIVRKGLCRKSAGALQRQTCADYVDVHILKTGMVGPGPDKGFPWAFGRGMVVDRQGGWLMISTACAAVAKIEVAIHRARGTQFEADVVTNETPECEDKALVPVDIQIESGKRAVVVLGDNRSVADIQHPVALRLRGGKPRNKCRKAARARSRVYNSRRKAPFSEAVGDGVHLSSPAPNDTDREPVMFCQVLSERGGV